MWVPNNVEVEFENLAELLHYDHSAWICPRVLSAYFDMFAELRSAGLGTWTADVTVAYDKGLEIAKGFSIM